MSRRKPLPHEDVVKAIREHVAHGNRLASIQISDDSDMWAVGCGQESPINILDKSVCEAFDEARALGASLLELGEPATAAVAKGLRTTGRWREDLLPFAERHRDLPAIRDALKLVSLRRRDPLVQRAARLVRGLPTAFSASIGGNMGRSVDVALEGGALVYRCWDCDYQLVSEERLDPGTGDWAAFIAELRRLRVDAWSRQYNNDSVHDGTCWGLCIDADGLRAKSSGTDAYPEDFGEFLEAVRRLLGGRKFR